MLSYRKFGAVLYCSTTIVATVVVGFALFIGAVPSNVNLLGRNCDVKNWLFTAAAFSLAYIMLSAFTMFCVLVGNSTKKLDSSSKYAAFKVSRVCVDTDSIEGNLQQENKDVGIVGPPLFQTTSNVIDKSLTDSTVSGRQYNTGISYGKLQSTKKDKDIVQVNVGGYFDDQYNQEGSLSSSIYGYIPSSQLRLNHETDDLIKIDEKNGNKSKIIDGGSEQRYLRMYVPEHIYLDV